MASFYYTAVFVSLVALIITVFNRPIHVPNNPFSRGTGTATPSFTPTVNQTRPAKTFQFVPESFTPPPDIRPALCLAAAEERINAKAPLVATVLGSATGQVESYYPETPCFAYQQRFQLGAIYYVSGATEAFSVHDDISAHYDMIGAGAVGFPITDQMIPADGVGRFNNFQNGAIFWKSNLGAHSLWGLVHQFWVSEGAETNDQLGYPIGDEFNPDISQITFNEQGADLMVSFENGVLLWDSKNPDAGVFELDGGAQIFGALTQSEVQTQIETAINWQLEGKGTVEDISQFQVTDYSIDQWGFHNRRYIVTTHIEFHLSGFAETLPLWIGIPLLTPNPRGDITFDIEIRLNRATENVEYVIWDATWTIGPPFGSAVSAALGETLKPLMGKPQVLQPAGNQVLEVKPMGTGDLFVFIHPFDL
jgi:hypothetical protein